VILRCGHVGERHRVKAWHLSLRKHEKDSGHAKGQRPWRRAKGTHRLLECTVKHITVRRMPTSAIVTAIRVGTKKVTTAVTVSAEL